MLKYMNIKNFKSLRNVSLGFAPLNLLCGYNGMGKSSVMQALLLLRQSCQKDKNLDKLFLNGPLTNLGTAKDVFCRTADEQYIRFFIKQYEEEPHDLRYCYDAFSAQNDVLLRVPDAKNGQESFQTPLFSPPGSPLFPEKEATFHVPERLWNSKVKTDLLFDQVSAWMAEISPAFQNIDEFDSTRDYFGSGFSTILSLIVELLVSGKDSLILLEHPESHLHPRGQSVIARLMALAVAGGTQIICETHSDCFVHGIRVAVKQKQIAASDVSISYFSMNENKETQIDFIEVDEKGRLDSYPVGFLDERTNQLVKLL
jgi:predicted ATPase